MPWSSPRVAAPDHGRARRRARCARPAGARRGGAPEEGAGAPPSDAPPEPPKKETTEEAFANAERPLPSDPKTFYLGGLFILALLVACYFAQPIVVPVVMAFFLKMLLQPIGRLLARFKIPGRLPP